jgi:hypothetical protein
MTFYNLLFGVGRRRFWLLTLLHIAWGPEKNFEMTGVNFACKSDFFSSPSLTFGDSFDSDSIQGTGSTPRDINSEVGHNNVVLKTNYEQFQYVSVLEKINDSLKLIGDLRKGYVLFIL